MNKAKVSGRRLDLVEKEEIGTTHAIVGAYLLGVWGLPYLMAETVAFHHTPSLVTEGDCDVLAAVHIAGALADAALAGTDALTDGSLDLKFVERMGMSKGIPEWRDAVAAQVAKLRGN